MTILNYAFLTIVNLAKAPLLKKIIGLIFAVITSLFIQLQVVILAMWLLMFINTYFGIKVSFRANKSKKRYFFKMLETIKAQKLEETVGKGMSYLIILICVVVINDYIINLEKFNLLHEKASLLQMTAGVLAFVEIWSIGENFGKLYGINPVSWILKMVQEKKIIKPIKNEKNND